MKQKLVLFASILGLASAPAAQAFDFFTSTANVADTGTFWSNNLTLGAYNAYLATSPAVVHPMSDLLIANGGAGITITTLLSDTGTFGINHQDLTLSPAGFNVNYNFTGTNTLFFPDSFRAPDAAELNGAGVNNVKKYIAGGDTTVFEGVQWAFSNAITVLQTNIYLVPEANHGTFSGSDVLFTNVADSRSQIVAAPTPFNTLRVNTASTLITITFAFVPEANPLYVILPGIAVGGGFTILRRARKNRNLKV